MLRNDKQRGTWAEQKQSLFGNDKQEERATAKTRLVMRTSYNPTHDGEAVMGGAPENKGMTSK